MMDATFVILIFLSVAAESQGQLVQKSATACFEAQGQSCSNFYNLTCEGGSRIRINSAIYGLKTRCQSGSRCLRSRDGCCVYNRNDCHGNFTALHMYGLYTACSMRQKCTSQATHAFMPNCEDQLSTYVHIEYECVPESTLLPLCSGDSIGGTEVNLVFDGTSNMYSDRTECKCFMFLSDGNVDIRVDDLRMFKSTTENPGSDCSSANLTLMYNGSPQLPQCSSNKNEEENFLYDIQENTQSVFIGISLSRLHENGPSDKPTMVWLSLSALEVYGMQVTCTAQGSTIPTLPVTSAATSSGTTAITSPAYTVSTVPSNGSTGAQTDDGGNSGAVVAGVLIPLILLIIVGVVVGYIFWKRKKKELSKGETTARPNSYTEDFDVYAEIGNVPDDPEPPIYDPVYEPPLYDRVYEPGNRGSTGSANSATSQSNGHLQVDQSRLSVASSDVQVPTKAPKQSSRNPFRLVSARTDRLFAWFRNQTGNSSADVARGKNRAREPSDCSYDHIKKNRPVIVRVISPDETHVYSHTNNSPPAAAPSVSNPVERSPKGGRISKDMSAINAGDSYIEFTFDTIDRNDPKLVKAPEVETDANGKPLPPARPLPSPTESPRNSGRSASPLLEQQGVSGANIRPKSPAFLSPASMSENDRPMYDYAESQPNSRRGSDASRSDISDHSYKILEKQQEYDYAAPLDGVDSTISIQEDDDNPMPVYEDVEEGSRSNSGSSSEETVYESGYEVPIKLQVAPEPPSGDKKVAKPKTAVNAPAPDIGKLNKELLQAGKFKPLKHIGDKSPAVSPNLASKKDNATTKFGKEGTSKVNATNKQKTKTSSAGYVNVTKFPEDETKDSNSVPLKIILKETTSEDPSHVKSDNVKTKDYEKAENLKGVRNMAQLFESKA